MRKQVLNDSTKKLFNTTDEDWKKHDETTETRGTYENTEHIKKMINVCLHEMSGVYFKIQQLYISLNTILHFTPVPCLVE